MGSSRPRFIQDDSSQKQQPPARSTSGAAGPPAGAGRASKPAASNTGKHTSRQLHAPDSIDALDSTLGIIYGGPSSSSYPLAVHSGPYDAASPHRNRNPGSQHAPVGAFSSNLGIVDPITGTVIGGSRSRDDGPYGAVGRSPPPSLSPPLNQNSPYPPLRSPSREAPPLGSTSPKEGPVFGPGSSNSGDMKARHHELMFGVQEGEAYEDFARGGKISLEQDRRASMTRGVGAPTQPSEKRLPAAPQRSASDLAGPGKGSTFGHGPLRIVDPRDGKEELINGMGGLGLYGGNNLNAQWAAQQQLQQPGLGQTTFLEGSVAAPNSRHPSSGQRSRGPSGQGAGNEKSPSIGGPQEYETDKKSGEYPEDSLPTLGPGDSGSPGQFNVKRNRSLAQRLKGMRINVRL